MSMGRLVPHCGSMWEVGGDVKPIMSIIGYLTLPIANHRHTATIGAGISHIMGVGAY